MPEGQAGTGESVRQHDLWMAKTSNRDLARRIGVSETAVRHAENAGRIKREPDGSRDPAKVQAAWADNTDQAQQRPGPEPGGESPGEPP